MPLWKQLLLTLYYHGTYPMRLCNYWREVSREHLPIIALCYHRVAEDRANDWTLPYGTFLRQIRWLGDRFQFISLSEAQRRIRYGYNHESCICVTFDDGYSDNCRSAIPLLLKEGIPCTYFVTLRNVLRGEPFSHDLVMGNRFAPNTLEQLRAMAKDGIDIGVHAYTHADLAAIADPRLLRCEVVAAKHDLEEAVGRPARYFAFPFGLPQHLNRDVFELARQAGYDAVCSAYGGFNFPGDDPFHVQRIPVDTSLIRLKNWVTMDPRKLRVPRYEYRDNPKKQDAKAKPEKELVTTG
jgi:peptidoglycan/xylan/chitin deacetylase (PgdA/CDA1 family)